MGSTVVEMLKIYDIVGIGFGPSNIATAIAAFELAPSLSVVFVEAKDEFGWHKGMLFENATMQVSFLKDLVSFRNPRSHYSFLNYLHTRGRLADFANLKEFFPTRLEFHDYLAWCAAHFKRQVLYDHHAIRIDEVRSNVSSRPLLKVTVRNGYHERTLIARAVVHAGGLEPSLPQDVTPGRRIIHGHTLLHTIGDLSPTNRSRFVVAGSGQSAAEIVEFLHGRYPQSTVTAVIPRYGYMPADDSPFVNQVFDPAEVDNFYDAPPATKRRILEAHASTNYGVADLDLISSLYRTWYREKVSGTERLKFERMSYVRSAIETGDHVRILVERQLEGTVSSMEADYLICATGFRPRSVIELLCDPLRAELYRNGGDAPQFARSYRLLFKGGGGPDIYSVDMCEQTHGLSATLISNMAVRSGEIVDDILERCHQEAAASEIADA